MNVSLFLEKWYLYGSTFSSNKSLPNQTWAPPGFIFMFTVLYCNYISCNLNWRKRCKVIINHVFFILYPFYRPTNPNRLSLLPSRMGCCSCGRPMRGNSCAISTWWLLYGLVFLCLHCCYCPDFRMLRAFGPSWNRNVCRWYPGWNQQRKTSRLHIVINLDTAKLLYYINLFCTCMYV